MSVRQDVPVYRLLEPFFSPIDHLHKVDECIAWEGTPNEHMEPLNKLAQEALETYLLEQDELGRKAAEKAGVHYAGRMNLDAAITNAHSEARRVSLKSGDGGVPIVSGKKANVPLIQTVEDPSSGGKEVVHDLTGGRSKK